MWRQLSSRSLRWFFAVSTLLTVFVTVGCGPEPEPVGSITGKVLSGDTAIGNCKVAIKNPETLVGKAATVDEAGNFKLENVSFGEYEVRVYPAPSQAAEVVPDPRIPKKARRFASSGYSVSVQSADEVVNNIDLKK